METEIFNKMRVRVINFVSSGYPFPTRPGMGSRSHSNPTVPTYLTLGQMNRTAPKSKLRLSNYIAPSSSHDDDDVGDVKPSAASPFGRSSIQPTEFSAIASSCIIGGMPATAPSPVTTPSSMAANLQKALESPSLPSSKLSPVPSPNASTIFLDRRLTSSPDKVNDSYSHLVKNFCFHQSTPSTGTTTSSVPLKEPWHDSFGGQHTMLMSL